MPTPSVTRLVRSATTLAAFSSAFGARASSARPTAGTNIASVKPHSWNQFISRPSQLKDGESSVAEDGDHEGDEPDRGEEEERVALESTGLQAAGAAGLSVSRRSR